ncbi:hypothetical protein [Kineosporia sp. A_224]|uniref:hypothetical protein n=1 Tax=Kineosporia sp. A_224 TaxID=1962180 RepID=UPI000B4BA9ED|nr:hypothetical protein [Kineosporia sp. A_224]
MSADGGWGTQGHPPGPGYVPAPGMYAPAPPRRDSTRTVAVLALVVSVVCLLALLMTQLLPMLMFGMLGLGGMDPFSEGDVGGFGGSVHDGSVAVTPGGSVDAAALATAVTLAAQGELFGAVTCDPVAKAVADVSVLCRGDEADEIRSYAVVRFTDGTGRFQVMSFTYG